MRVMRELVISLDDIIPLRISYPSELNPGELADVKDTVAIWLRSLERRSVVPQSGKG